VRLVHPGPHPRGPGDRRQVKGARRNTGWRRGATLGRTGIDPAITGEPPEETPSRAE
jgi:hypothetical protein